VWVSDATGKFRKLRTYPILGASGSLGPKLMEGDDQVPEGVYRIESLNPNSMFHLSLRLTYPNEFDKEKGNLDGRHNLGTDIMIHGGERSVGCLAMGDEAAEDLFILAAETGIENVSVIISPVDFRIRDFPAQGRDLPGWAPELYEHIKTELAKLH
jgi:murein L,D-transpeptidase YafK